MKRNKAKRKSLFLFKYYETIFVHVKLNQFQLIWQDFLSQDSNKDFNFKLKYNGKASKCLREIKYN